MAQPNRRGYFGVASSDGHTFSDSTSGDALLFVPDPTQKILIGTRVDSNADLAIARGRLGVGTADPAVALDLSSASDALALPVGCNLERPGPSNLRQGMVRYNTELQSFEGYGAGDAWQSLGGVIDINKDTYVLAELAPGCNDDTLRFFASNQEKMNIDKDFVKVLGFLTVSSEMDSNVAVTETASSSFWNKNSSNHVFYEHRVGVGTSAPQHALDVLGTASATQFVGIGSNLDRLNAGAITWGLLDAGRLPIESSVSSFCNDRVASADSVRRAYSNADARAFAGGCNAQDFAASNLVVSGAVLPATSGSVDLGASNARFRDLYLEGNTIYLGEQKISVDSNTGSITLGNPSNSTVAALRFAGSGSNLTSLNADELFFGTVPAARLPIEASVSSFCNDRVASADSVRQAYSNADARAFADGSLTQDFAASNVVVSGRVLPSASGAVDLGASNLRFRDLYLEGESIFLGSQKISVDPVSGSLDLGSSNSTVIALEFAGIGSNLTSLNAGQLTWGAVPAARLPIEVSLASFCNDTVASANSLRLAYSNAESKLPLAGGTVSGSLTVTGDFTVSGTTTTVNTESILVKDNLVILNTSLSNDEEPPGGLVSGIVVNRGSASNYFFVFEEATQSFKVGLSNDLQAVATRPDSVPNKALAYWDSNATRLDFAAGYTVNESGVLVGSGSNLTALNAGALSWGTVSNDRTTASSANSVDTLVLRDSTGSFAACNVTATTFSGIGSNLTDLNAGAITWGTVPNDRTNASSANSIDTLVLRDSTGSFSACNVTATSFSGIGSNLTLLNAGALTWGILSNAVTTASSANTAGAIVARDASCGFSASNVSATSLSVAGDVALSGGNLFVGTTTNHNLSLRTSNVDRITVSSNGNVGVGTVTPGATLDVNGTIRQKAYHLEMYASVAPNIYLGSSTTSYTLQTQPFNTSGTGYYYFTYTNNRNTNFPPIVQNTVQYKVPINGFYIIKLVAQVYASIFAEFFISKNKGGNNDAGVQDLNNGDGNGPIAVSNGTAQTTMTMVTSLTTTDYLCFGFYCAGTNISSGTRNSASITFLYGS